MAYPRRKHERQHFLLRARLMRKVLMKPVHRNQSTEVLLIISSSDSP